jgi:hypothetical protein
MRCENATQESDTGRKIRHHILGVGTTTVLQRLLPIRKLTELLRSDYRSSKLPLFQGLHPFVLITSRPANWASRFSKPVSFQSLRSPIHLIFGPSPFGVRGFLFLTLNLSSPSLCAFLSFRISALFNSQPFLFPRRFCYVPSSSTAS